MFLVGQHSFRSCYLENLGFGIESSTSLFLTLGKLFSSWASI